jgi:hypothetical protein
MNFYESVAKRKLGIESPEWMWCNLQRIGPDATKVEGGVPKLLTRGKRKGLPAWKGIPLDVCIVTDAEFKAEKETYETTTGNCYACCGTKQVLASWSSTEGTAYDPCRRCNATGLKP